MRRSERASGWRASRFACDGSEYLVLSCDLSGWPGEPLLTLAERQVARAAAAGWSNRRIAASRRSSERTVANQLASIYQKLGIGSRAQLAALMAAGVRGSSAGV